MKAQVHELSADILRFFGAFEWLFFTLILHFFLIVSISWKPNEIKIQYNWSKNVFDSLIYKKKPMINLVQEQKKQFLLANELFWFDFVQISYS